jgi:hypothetical protein
LTIAAVAGGAALASDRGPQPPQPRPGWIDSMTSVEGAEKFNRRAKAINDGLDQLLTQEGRRVADVHAVLKTHCKGMTGEKFSGGNRAIAPILADGICSQYVRDLGDFVKTGKTNNFAKCSALHGAIKHTRKIKSDPVWWYVGEEAARLERHMLRMANTPFMIRRVYISSEETLEEAEVIRNPLYKGHKFYCPFKEK